MPMMMNIVAHGAQSTVRCEDSDQAEGRKLLPQLHTERKEHSRFNETPTKMKIPTRRDSFCVCDDSQSTVDFESSCEDVVAPRPHARTNQCADDGSQKCLRRPRRRSSSTGSSSSRPGVAAQAISSNKVVLTFCQEKKSSQLSRLRRHADVHRR